MKADKKAERLAALFGLDAPKKLTPQQKDAADTSSREAEAVLAYYEVPAGFTERMCKQCERLFTVNRGSIAYCSDVCRAKALAEIGIGWDFTKPPTERWSAGAAGPEPLTVTPHAYALVHPIVEERLQQETEQAGQAGGQSSGELTDPLALPDKQEGLLPPSQQSRQGGAEDFALDLSLGDFDSLLG